jgi:predicted kinase
VRSSLRRRKTPRVATVISSLQLASAGLGPPALVLLVGLPGAGKSTFARALSDLTGAVVLESDRFRTLLFPQPVFSMRESTALFRALAAATKQLLDRGYAVIVDATNLSESDRRPFYDLAKELDVALLVIALEAPLDVIERRLERRTSEPAGYSLADIDVYHRMRGRVEPISRKHWRVDTSNQIAYEAALKAVAAAYHSLKGNVAVEGTGLTRGKAS